MREAIARAGRVCKWLAPFVIPALVFDVVFIVAALDRSGGELCPSFDDAFIHFQYARSFAELHPLSYHAGDAPTTGATSLLYPMVLSVGWLVGFRGMAIVWFAHGVAVLCLGLTSAAAYRLGERTVGRAEGIAAAASVYCIPGFVFLAFSGMEIALVTLTQVAAVGWAVLWITAARRGEARTVRGAWVLVGLGVAAVLARPENVTAAAATSLALLFAAADRRRWTRVLALVPVSFAGMPALIAWAVSGRPRTSGMILKWIPADPYRDRSWMWKEIGDNLSDLWSKLLDGDTVGREIPYAMTPDGYRWVLAAGMVALGVHYARRFGRAGLVATLALVGGATALLFPATYTWFGNLGRYVVPFLPLLAIAAVLGFGGLGRWIGERSRAKASAHALLASAAAVFAFSGLPDVLDVPVQAASEMCAQQVPMARYIRSHLPRDARVAINDAGALAYLGGHRTYDLVGLTTAGEARPYAAGIGSVFERLEDLPRARRPTHFAFYPSWFPHLGLPGELIHVVATPHAKHVGGARKELRPLREELVGSGASPLLVDPEGELVDELDVADLESEEAHEYRMEGADRGGDLARTYEVSGHQVADGGRVLRDSDTFAFHAHPGRAATWVLRTDAWYDTHLKIYWNGESLERVHVEQKRTWSELVIDVPAERVEELNLVERYLDGPGDAGLFHDWLYQPSPASR